LVKLKQNQEVIYFANISQAINYYAGHKDDVKVER